VIFHLADFYTIQAHSETNRAPGLFIKANCY